MESKVLGIYSKNPQKYPVDIVELAYEKFPIEMEYIPDIDLGCPGTYEDANERARHAFILGAISQRMRCKGE